MSLGDSRRALWYPPVLWSLLILALAPFMGRIQELSRARLGGSFRALLLSGLIVLALACLIWAGLRIREHRWARWSGLALVLVLLGIQMVFFRRSDANTDLAEKIHLVEYGWLAFLVYRASRPLQDRRQIILPVLWVAAVGTLDEWAQWLAPTRVGDWVDVALDLFAGVCGLIFALAWSPPDRLRPLQASALRACGWTAAALVLLFASFMSQAHLGYSIQHPSGLDFVSWHDPKSLLEASQDRASSWASQPPGRLPLIGIEDVYRTEAAFHVMCRNAAATAGDIETAWKENRILELYFEPFLAFRTAHRWPAAQRKNVEAGLRPGTRGYSSPVLVERIFVHPSKRVFWSFASLLALGVGLAATWVGGRRVGARD